MNRQRMRLQHHAGGFDRNDPAGREQRVDVFHARGTSGRGRQYTCGDGLFWTRNVIRFGTSFDELRMAEIAREILHVNLEDEMRQSYLDYAMSVIVGRALPDVRDGLKPVHRRILFAMHESNNVYSRPYVKCARVVGDVLGKYHPHGDTSAYDALVRMAQNFSMRYHAGRRPGQLRLGGRRSAGGLSLHRMPHDVAGRASCSPTSIARRSISSTTTTARKKSRSCCRRACRTC